VGDRLADDNQIIDFIDDKLATQFVDDADNATFDGSMPAPDPTPLPVPEPALAILITSPNNGAVIKGNGGVYIRAASNVAGTITIKADGGALNTASNATACSITWSGKSITRGAHTISATVANPSGSASALATIQKR